MRFYLGTHIPNWLSRDDRPPLFISRRALERRRTMPRAAGSWALDSGGFTELAMFGAWTMGPTEYVAAVRRYRDEIGMMDWASPQDWMVEPAMLLKTGLTVAEHQRRTIANFLDLRTSAPELPIIPVVQGWTRDDYLRHVDMYAAVGVDLEAEGLVGVGSVCRRQNMSEALDILAALAPLRLHGFGFKVLGLTRGAQMLKSADSLAWSYRARRDVALPGCTHKACNNCIVFARQWAARIERAIEAPKQWRFVY